MKWLLYFDGQKFPIRRVDSEVILHFEQTDRSFLNAPARRSESIKDSENDDSKAPTAIFENGMYLSLYTFWMP